MRDKKNSVALHFYNSLLSQLALLPSPRSVCFVSGALFTTPKHMLNSVEITRALLPTVVLILFPRFHPTRPRENLSPPKKLGPEPRHVVLLPAQLTD